MGYKWIEWNKVKSVTSILFLFVFLRISFGQDIAHELFSQISNEELDTKTYELYLAKCDSALENTPNDFNSRFSKAIILDYQRKYSQSREQYQMIVSIDSTIAYIYYNLAATYINEYENLLYVPEYSNIDKDGWNTSAYWECKGNEKACMEIAQIIYPLLKKSVQLEIEELEDDPEFFKKMESSLREFIQGKK